MTNSSGTDSALGALPNDEPVLLALTTWATKPSGQRACSRQLHNFVSFRKLINWASDRLLELDPNSYAIGQ